MALWGRVKDFVTKFEQDIDAEFSKNVPAPVKEQVENLQIDEDSDNETTNVKFKGDENEENKKKLLIENIESAVKQIEELNLQQEKLIKLKQDMGVDGERCIIEYEKRKVEFENQISQCANTENILNEEINQLMKHTSELSDAQTEKELVTNQVNDIQNYFNKISQDEINLMNELTAITNKMSDIEQEILRNTSYIEKLSKDEKDFKQKIPEINTRIQPMLEENEKLSDECGNFSVSLRKEQNNKQNYLSQQQSLQDRINALRAKIVESNKAADQMKLTKIQQKENAMKEFLQQKISQLNKEKSDILQQITELQEFKSGQVEEYDDETYRFKSLLDVSRVENQQLNIRLESLQKSLKDVAKPLREQLDSLKSMHESSTKAWDSFALRIKQDIADNNAKIDINNEKCTKINEDIENEKKLNEEMKTQMKNMENEMIEMKNSCRPEIIDEANAKINEARRKAEAKGNELMKIELSMRELKQKVDSVERNKELLKEKLIERLNAAQFSIEQGKKPTTFSKWKDLTRKVAELEKEEAQLKNDIKQDDQIRVLFNQSIELISERQEQVDAVKRTIQKEKQHFKKQLLEIYGE